MIRHKVNLNSWEYTQKKHFRQYILNFMNINNS